MKVSISYANQKMGRIPSISFPPVVTCADGVPCARKCYALRMSRLHKNVRDAWQGNLDAWRENPEIVRANIMAAAFTSSVFRYFVGGDIPDAAFFVLMVEIARAVPSCRFLAFTKKYKIVNKYISERGALPENLTVIFSAWGVGMLPENPHNLPESAVIFRGEQPPQGAKICGGNCAACLCEGVACWSIKKGEKIHFYEH